MHAQVQTRKFSLKWHVHKTSVPEIDEMENSTSTHERTILRPKSSPETTDEIYTSTHGRIHAKTMFWFINQERSRAIKLMDECKVLHQRNNEKRGEVSRRVMLMLGISPRRVESSKHFIRYHPHGRVEILKQKHNFRP